MSSYAEFIGCRQEKKLLLVAYDIADNKRRTRFVKFLNKKGCRVQKSVFEIYIDWRKVDKFLKEASSLLNEEDRLRVYSIRRDDLLYGRKEGTFDDGYALIA